MAKNQNPALKNKHVLYCGTSGAGKTQAMAQNIPRLKTRVLLWDTHKTFRANQCDTISQLKRELAKAIRSGKAFCISYTGRGSAECFEQFCSAAWDILDGNKILHIGIDELSEVTKQGKAMKHFHELLAGARKFGGILHISANALPEVPTTVRRETLNKWAGQQQTYTDKKLMADFMSAKPDIFDGLESLEFIVLEDGEISKRKIKPKKPPL